MGSILPVSREGILLPGGPQTRDPRLFAVPDGLVGYWGFDADCLDFTNNLALDLTTKGNNGTLSNLSASAFAAGQVGGALSFNGSGVFGAASGVSLASAIATTTTYSLAQWIKPGSSQHTYANLITQGAASGVWLQSSKIDLFFLGADHRNNTAIPANVWTHWAVTCAVGAVIFYINGMPDGATTNAQTFNAQNIGNDTAGLSATESYNGLIDDVRIYNRALSPWEVLQLYQAGLSGRRDAGMWMPGDVEMGMIGRPRGLPPFQRMVA